jgi:type VI secretion system protein VasG
VLPRISHELLTCMLDGRSVERVHLAVADGEFGYAFD